jgi:glycogen debranching enzyme
LFAGIASEARARRTADTLMGEHSYSGWGIRTVSSLEAAYNPMSYHNGSIWPHDNALIAYGFDRYGMKDKTTQILNGLFDASGSVDLRRLPELFCGFHRRPGEGPTLYPVACSPQAWASGAVFLLLQSALGLSIDGVDGKIMLENPTLPEFFNELHIQNLCVGRSSVDLFFHRRGADVGVHVTRREGPVRVVVGK